MITVKNFNTAVTDDLLKQAPDTLKQLYPSVKNKLQFYNESEKIKALIDTYISKLNAIAGSKAKPKPAAKPQKKKPVNKQAERKASATKKPATKPKTKTQKQLSFEQVAKVSPEVRFVKRYVLMNNKRKTRKQLLAFINSLQRAIEKKEIRKTSKYAKEIMHIQNELLKIYNNPDVGEAFTFKLDESDKSIVEKFNKIAGSEKQRVSVRLISRYIGIHGKTNVKEKAERLLKAISNAFQKKQVEKSDPYINELKTVESNLQKFIKEKSSKLHINKVELKGLLGIPGMGMIKFAHNIKPGDKVLTPFGDEGTVSKVTGKTVFLKEFPQHAINKDYVMKLEPSHTRTRNRLKPNLSGIGQGEVISASQLEDINYDTYGFTGKWLSIIGDPSIPFNLMFWSKPGKGKSSLAIQLSKYLAERFNQKVLFVAKEEGLSYTLKDKFARFNAFHPNIHIVEELPASLEGYDVVTLDSVTRLKMQPDDFVALKKKYPHTTFILVFQATSDGGYRGNKEWEHEVDVSIFINDNGYAHAEKTRFGGTGTIKVFKGTPDHIYRFTHLQDAEKFVANRKDEKLSMVQGDDGKVWVTNTDKANELKKQGYQLF